MFTRNHASHTTLRIGHVTFISWYQVHVAVEHRLACGLIDIDAHVVAIGMETLVNFLLHVLQHDVHCFSLMVGKVEVISDMAFGNNQGMPRRDRITIIESNTSGCFADDFHSSRQTTERTSLALLTRQFVEVLILIEFITFVGYQTLIGQFYITLIGVLLVNSMQPETFFRQVSTHSKVCRSFGRKQIGDVHHHFCLCIRFQHIQDIMS